MDMNVAKDRVTDLEGSIDAINTALLEKDEDASLVSIQFDTADLIRAYETDTRFGDRWSMQKAMVCMWTDRPETTIHEVAYWIGIVFDKPNYGVGRAKIDLKKFLGHKFKCHDLDAIVETATAE